MNASTHPSRVRPSLTRRTLAWFPVRVWRHFLQHNGFLLAAGVSYQSLFAIFGVIYLAFAIVGLWLGASSAAIQRVIEIINEYIPNLISEEGLVTPEQVEDVANQSASALGITGAIALVVVIWTAIGFITFTRRAVRDIFGLPFDRRPYVLLKARDFVAALIFGVALLIGASLSSFAVWALEGVVDLLGLQALSVITDLLTRLLSLGVSFAINAAALAALIRFLTGAALGWRRIWPGAMLGGAAIVVLQVGAGLLLRYTPSNPLLTTFTVFIGFLLWFRLNSIVILVAGAWIAVAAADRNVALAGSQRRGATPARMGGSSSPPACGCATPGRRWQRRRGSAGGTRPALFAAPRRISPRWRPPRPRPSSARCCSVTPPRTGRDVGGAD